MDRPSADTGAVFLEHVSAAAAACVLAYRSACSGLRARPPACVLAHRLVPPLVPTSSRTRAGELAHLVPTRHRVAHAPDLRREGECGRDSGTGGA